MLKLCWYEYRDDEYEYHIINDEETEQKHPEKKFKYLFIHSSVLNLLIMKLSNDLFKSLRQRELKDSIDNQHTLLKKLSCLHYEELESLSEDTIIKTKLSYLYKYDIDRVAK